MKVVQVNSVVNSGSTGRITEDIGKVLISVGHESYIAYGRNDRPSDSKLFRIGTKGDLYLHSAGSLLLDRHGFFSRHATKQLINWLDKLKPDVIALHNLHGYYLNIEELFRYLAAVKIPVVWTLFDCWAFTGHCSYFDDIGCEKWKTLCYQCPKSSKYPRSLFLDNSRRNFLDKKLLFNLKDDLSLIVHSEWLKKLVEQSFLSEFPVHLIRSGVDTSVFRPSTEAGVPALREKKIVLGCASVWDKRKGFDDFIKLRQLLPESYVVMLIGLTRTQQNLLTDGIVGIERTENVDHLAQLYSAASVFVNPTYQDNFPTTNLEALACGTPVVTYDTGGSPEAIDDQTGAVVPKGAIDVLATRVKEIAERGKHHYQALCRERALKCFNKEEQFLEYLNIFQQMLDRGHAK